VTDPVLRLETARLSVEPGGQVQTTITVQNTGDIVEGYLLEVLGEDVPAWAQVLPAEVQVYPGQDTTAVLVLNPPSDAAAGSGTFPFAVRARSVVDESVSAVVEGDLDLGRVFGLQAKISPVTSTGRWRGRHLVQFTNWGNAPVRLKLTPTDPDEKLGFVVHPEIVEVPIGASTSAAVLVRTRKPFLRGQPVRLPFTVTAEPDPPEPVARGPGGPLPLLADPRRAAVDGALNQRPILSRLVVVLGVLALAAIGAGLYFALRPGPPPPQVALGTGVPRTPTLTATAQDPTTIVLSWQGETSLDSYNLYQVAADGKKSNVTAVDGTLEQTQVGDLQPGTQYCFRLQAVRAKLASGLSEPACVATAFVPVTTSAGPATVTSTAPPSGSGQTAPVSPPTSPGAPTSPPATDSGGVTSAPSGPGQSSGGPTTGGGPGGSTPPPTGGATTSVGQTAGGPDGSPGTPGQPTGGTVTVTVSPTGGGPSTVTTGRIQPGQFVVVLKTVPAQQPGAAALAAQSEQAAVAAGVPAKTLLTSDYPNLRFFPNTPAPQPTFVIYVGPFPSQAEAQTFSTRSPGSFVVQPNPTG
jgi:hypothetical protein